LLKHGASVDQSAIARGAKLLADCLARPIIYACGNGGFGGNFPTPAVRTFPGQPTTRRSSLCRQLAHLRIIHRASPMTFLTETSSSINSRDGPAPATFSDHQFVRKLREHPCAPLIGRRKTTSDDFHGGFFRPGDPPAIATVAVLSSGKITAVGRGRPSVDHAPLLAISAADEHDLKTSRNLSSSVMFP